MLSTLGFSRSNIVEYMLSKTSKENITLIWMFPNLFQANEVIEEDFETVEYTMELVYLVFFHLITPQIDLGMRKICDFISEGLLRFLYRVSLKENKQKSKPKPLRGFI